MYLPFNPSAPLASRIMSSPSKTSPSIVAALSRYTACDISDALVKLKVPGAGFLPDLIPYSKSPGKEVLVAPASTVYFVAKTDVSVGAHPPSNIPAGQHWADLVTPSTIVIESQPSGQTNAVLGGIMALRMKTLGVRAAVVSGRVRDLDEVRGAGLPVWARGTSTAGTGASTKAHAVNVPITVGVVTVNPGDYVFGDATNGVVVIPADKVEEVLELLPRLTEADERVKKEVERGISVQEAFEKHRSSTL